MFDCMYSPCLLFQIADRHDGIPLPIHLYSLLLAHLNSSVNSIIYGVSNKQFRWALLCKNFLRGFFFFACCRMIYHFRDISELIPFFMEYFGIIMQSAAKVLSSSMKIVEGIYVCFCCKYLGFFLCVSVSEGETLLIGCVISNKFLIPSATPKHNFFCCAELCIPRPQATPTQNVLLSSLTTVSIRPFTTNVQSYWSTKFETFTTSSQSCVN